MVSEIFGSNEVFYEYLLNLEGRNDLNKNVKEAIKELIAFSKKLIEKGNKAVDFEFKNSIIKEALKEFNP